MKHQSGLLEGLFIFVISITLIFAQIERDIILTPKLGLQIKGKTLYYKPSGEDHHSGHNKTTNIPWEQTLKHVTYLTLNNEITEKSENLSEIPEYKRFLKSPYIQSNENIPKFGDIITLAKGRLEKVNSDEYRFVEGHCTKKCTEEQQKSIASWIVQKIRHRDADRKFRYEIKFSVSPNISDKSDSKREIGKRRVRAFVLKDDDYPKNFLTLDQHIAQRRYDENRNYIDRLGEFNQIFSQPRYFHSSENPKYYNQLLPELNIGEYIPAVTSMTPKISSHPHKVIFPTTYRPAYHVKLSKPTFLSHSSSTKYPQYSLNAYEEESRGSNSITTTHLHHHYYVTKPQLPDTISDLHDNKQIASIPYLQDHRGAIELIERPLNSSPNPINVQQNYQTPPPITNQIPVPPNMSTHIQITQTPYSIPFTSPIIPPPPVIYMQPIPITHHVPVYVYPRNNEHQIEYAHPTKPFVESPRDEKIRYSEPDPLYQDFNLNSDNTLPGHLGDHQQEQSTDIAAPPSAIDYDETTGGEELSENESQRKPDSINAQLPPPDNEEDLTVPYVETSIVTETSATSARLVAPKSNSIEGTSSESMDTLSTTEPGNDKKVDYNKPETKASIEKDILKATAITTERDYVVKTKNLNKKQFSTKTSLQQTFLPEFLSKTLPPTALDPKISENSDKRNFLIKQFPSTKSRSHIRSTTERPVLKWKPKRTKLAIITSSLPPTPETPDNSTKLKEFTNDKFLFESIPISIMEKIVTPVPSNSDDIPTKQSVSTSISIKVGADEEEQPFTPTITVPNVELYRADLENVGTNTSHIKLYMASDQRRISKGHAAGKEKDKKEQLELTNSIVKHVQSLP